MSKYFHHFLPLWPPATAEALEEIRSLQEITFYAKTGHELFIHLLGRPHTIDVIAVSCLADMPSEERGMCIEEIGNHMLAVLRLTYDQTADVIRNGDGFLNVCQESDDPLPVYNALVHSGVHPGHIVDVKNVAAVFCETANRERAPILALVAEAQTPHIPAHYKVLSLIRALEIMLPEDEREAWLNRYEDAFATLKISKRSFRNALPGIRTRCAHGISRGGEDPFVGQAYCESPQLNALLRLLRQVVADKARELYGLNICVHVQ